MRKLGLLLLLFPLVSSTAACSKTKVTRAADGVLRLECARGMKDCVAQAEKQCNVKDREAGYVILGGSSHKVIMGAEQGQYRTAVEVAELEVRCGQEPSSDRLSDEGEPIKLPPRTDPVVPPADLPAEPIGTPPPVGACTKGATQACVGPGACQGGQVCLPDGSGFGACDCGTSQAPSPRLDPAPLAPLPPSPPPGEAPVPLRQKP